jgi:hypothetical protein
MLPLVDAGPCLGPQTRTTRMRPPSRRPGMRTPQVQLMSWEAPAELQLPDGLAGFEPNVG